MRSLTVGMLLTLVASAAAQNKSDEKLNAVVSIVPQAYFVERVGGEYVKVEVLVGPGQSPHSYQATPKQMIRLAEAQVYFSIGVEFEKRLLSRLQHMFKDLTVVDTRANVPLRALASRDRPACDHDHDRGHDPHIWLSPRLVKIQAQTICDTLAELDPEHAEQYRRNLAAFHADLDRVHAEIAEVLAPLKGREVYVFHPAFGYFADEFGLIQVPIEVEGKRPSARQLVELIERAQANKIRVIFVQPQFSKKSAEAVAEAIGGVVVPMNPLARDYLRNLREMAERIKTVLKEESEAANGS
ncbi:MAG: zinc ABC transporter substrate-binding protein [Phycisphaerae bacterium]|nr:zinc ABC transporter substrate-binding protein [Phycisphaerae bacterium]